MEQSNEFSWEHIHNQETQKDSLMEKGLQRTILDFYYIYYFMIIKDWYMIITRTMSC
jgi:hypothetical protein